MKVGTTLELIVLAVVVVGMIYLVHPDPPQDTTETKVVAPADAPPMPVLPPAPPPPVLLPDRAPSPGTPKMEAEADSPDIVDIGIGCALFGGVAAGAAYFVVPAQFTAFAAGVAGSTGPAPAVSPGTALGTVGPVLAVGCAAGAMVVPWLASLFTGEPPRPKEFAVALDQARTTLGMDVKPATTGLLAPNERPSVIRLGSYAFNQPN